MSSSLVDPHPAAALEQDVELLLVDVAVAGRGLPGLQPPEPRAQRARLELLAEVRVEDPHLVRGAPEGVGGAEDAIGHDHTLGAGRVSG